jgi:hypothetical protein
MLSKPLERFAQHDTLPPISLTAFSSILRLKLGLRDSSNAKSDVTPHITASIPHNGSHLRRSDTRWVAMRIALAMMVNEIRC